MPPTPLDPLKTLRNTILVTDVLSGLSKLPDESIDCVVTSPPYWGLRDYSIAPLIWDAAPDCTHDWQPVIENPRRDRRWPEEKRAGGSAVSASQQAINYTVKDFGQFCSRCHAWRGCLGLEPTIALYLTHLMQIFDELHRVLKPSGTMWINLGDCYGGGWGLKRRLSDADSDNSVPTKSLSLLPHRFAIAMLSRGWILRNHVVWYKPNHMPASVRDRLANSWDHVFFFVKAQRYFFDLDAIRVPHRSLARVRAADSGRKTRRRQLEPHKAHEFNPNGKNPGDCWHIPSQATPYDHFATFAERLVEMPIRAGCPALVCSRCGRPKRLVRIKPPNPFAFDMQYRDAQAGHVKLPGRKAPAKEKVAAYDDKAYTSPGGPRVVAVGCGCRRPFLPGIALDPFMGTGTTALVTRRLGRDFIGFEISERYAAMARERVGKAA